MLPSSLPRFRYSPSFSCFSDIPFVWCGFFWSSLDTALPERLGCDWEERNGNEAPLYTHCKSFLSLFLSIPPVYILSPLMFPKINCFGSTMNGLRSLIAWTLWFYISLIIYSFLFISPVFILSSCFFVFLYFYPSPYFCFHSHLWCPFYPVRLLNCWADRKESTMEKPLDIHCLKLLCFLFRNLVYLLLLACGLCLRGGAESAMKSLWLLIVRVSILFFSSVPSTIRLCRFLLPVHRHGETQWKTSGYSLFGSLFLFYKFHGRILMCFYYGF